MPTTPPLSPPESICLLRLSALGDVTHMLPVVHRLRASWPDTRLHWVIGRREHALMQALPDVHFHVLDKSAGWAGYRNLYQELAPLQFDVLLLMQVSMRAHLASLGIRARRRIGYDPVRSRDLHRWFISERIPHRDRQHVLDGQLSFLDYLQVPPARPSWELPFGKDAGDWAATQLPGNQPTLLISPASSAAIRNWHCDGYAQVADYAIRECGMRVALVGGPSERERQMAAEIEQYMHGKAINLVGRDTLPRLMALLSRATALISPDSGPAHMAAITGTPVIGLYGVSNPQRCGPYRSLAYTVDAYPEACRSLLGRETQDLPWGTRVEKPQAMQLIRPEHVIQQLDIVLQQAQAA